MLRNYLLATLAAVLLLMTTTSTSLLGKEGGKLCRSTVPTSSFSSPCSRHSRSC